MIVTFEEHCIEIVVDLENYEGMTNSTGASCSNAHVAISADASLFENLFIGYINDDLLTTINPLLLVAVGGGLVVLVLVVLVVMKRR